MEKLVEGAGRTALDHWGCLPFEKQGAGCQGVPGKASLQSANSSTMPPSPRTLLCIYRFHVCRWSDRQDKTGQDNTPAIKTRTPFSQPREDATNKILVDSCRYINAKAYHTYRDKSG